MSHMSSTPTTVHIPTGHGSVKRYAIAVALVLALVAGAFGAVSLLTGAEPVSPAVVDDPRFVPGVGLVEDAHEVVDEAGASSGLLRQLPTDPRFRASR